MREITCCFTGHRPQNLPFGGEEGHADCLRIKAELEARVREAVADGYRVFLSGMALGADLWAAETVLRLKEQDPGISLHCILPFAAQASRWDRANRARHERILGLCDEAVAMRPVYTRACMFERNREMIARSNRLIAVYDGRGRGGTCYTVKLARYEGLEVVVIDPCGGGEAQAQK